MGTFNSFEWNAGLFGGGEITAPTNVVTVQSIYDEICIIMLEDSGMVYFATEVDVIRMIQAATIDFLQRTGIIKDFFPVAMVAGTAAYARPETAMKIQGAIVDESYIDENTTSSLDLYNKDWVNEVGRPEYWTEQHEGNNFRITPTPDSSGEIKLLATIQPTFEEWTLDTTITLMPPSFSIFLKFFVLMKIFSTDGESKDMARARYCRARYQEGVNLGKAIMADEMLEEAS